MHAPAVDSLIERAVAEDIGAGDLTTDAIVPEEANAVAEVVVKAAGVVCGLELALAVMQALDPDARMETLIADGAVVAQPPAVAARITARARPLLSGERTALNLLQRLSGIATAARTHVQAVAGTGVEVLDTRKTAPGMRAFDKWAVACGGAVNHRAGLDEAILIKDNHVAIVGGIERAIEAVRAAHPDLPVEVEVEDLDGLERALAAQAEIVLLDNMCPDMLRQAVRRNGGRARLEASGGITLETIREVAEAGVDAISVGALTHSVAALDISLEVTLCPL